MEIGSEDEWVASHPIPTMKNDILARLSEGIKPLFMSSNNEDINTIRDTALKLADQHHDLESALILMKIALQLRPNGPLIKHKVEQWSSKLKLDLH